MCVRTNCDAYYRNTYNTYKFPLTYYAAQLAWPLCQQSAAKSRSNTHARTLLSIFECQVINYAHTQRNASEPHSCTLIRRRAAVWSRFLHAPLVRTFVRNFCNDVDASPKVCTSIPTVNQPTILGIILDNMLCFLAHTN